MCSTSIFNVEVRDIGNDAEAHFIQITELNDELKNYLDSHIINICEGDSDSDLTYIKTKLKNYLTPKLNSDVEIGSIAEFFAHLYLKECGYNQEFLFLNLEEGSIKKGFDGFYTDSGEEWLFESKSGRSTTDGINHPSKIKGAHDDLSSKVSGGAKNNPWENAYHHASQIDVGTPRKLREKLKVFSREYENKIYKEIKDFNVMPGSTIFYHNDWGDMDYDDLTTKLSAWAINADFKKLKAICVSNVSKDLFWQYLNS